MLNVDGGGCQSENSVTFGISRMLASVFRLYASSAAAHGSWKQKRDWWSVSFGGLPSGSLRALGGQHGMKVIDWLRQRYGKYVFRAVAFPYLCPILTSDMKVTRVRRVICLSTQWERPWRYLRTAQDLKMEKKKS